jgi:SAM-dependent methyltransferase
LHTAARNFVESVLKKSGPFDWVLEIGSYNVNGTIRTSVASNRYVGIDRLQGPGVDLVTEARDFDCESIFDLVLSMEAMEHTPEPMDIIDCAQRVLLPSGLFILTAAAPPRKPHGVDGRALKPGEFYANVEPAKLPMLLSRGWTDVKIQWDAVSGDIYATARKT